MEATATITVEEYDKLRQIRDSEGAILKQELKELSELRVELSERADMIKIPTSIHFPSFSWASYFYEGVSWSTGTELWEYIGKDDAIRRLTAEINDLKAKKRASLGQRIRFLFTGELE